MANMRVYELAKELNITTKDIADLLDNNNKTYKTMSGLNDDEVAKVRGKFGHKSGAAGNASKPKNEKANEAKMTENNTPKKDITKESVKDTADKKSHVSELYFPQNSSKGGKDNKNVKNDNSGANRGNAQKNGNSDNRNSRNDNRPNQNGDRNGDNRGFRNNDNRGDRNGNNRNFRNNDNRGDRNGNNRNFRNNDGRPNQNGDRNGNNRNFRNNDNRGDRNTDNRNGDNRGFRNNDNRGDRNGDNRGFRNNDNRSNQSGDRNNNRQGGFSNQGRRNDRRDSAPKDDFLFETKPDSRRPDSRKDNHKNDRKKDVEVKENLKFANSQLKKNVKKEEKEEDTIKQLVLPDSLTIKELADKMKVQPSVVVKKLFMQGKVVTINQEIDYDTAEEIALEFNCICEHEVKVDVIAELLKEDEEPEEKMVPRPPVVCVMGHVDHGKTSLLDAIRETHVTDKEFGGITQKIGAYTVDVNGQSITFLDTPGHEAFTAMRMRGAQATDIAILVVAADDGVMPQTIEAINHAKAAGIEIIVAINKIDKPSANIERVKQELTEYELIPEDWGGSTIFCPVSAHTGEGLDNLLEMILLTAEVLELKANPNRNARGIVIEAELDKGRGPVATMLVQKGTLHVGDYLAVGSSHGKVRAMHNSKGVRVTEATPSTPVQILGLDTVPSAGEIFMAVDNEKEARQISETYISQSRVKMLAETKSRMSLDDLYSQIQAGNVKELNIIIKADVQGSVEAVKQSLLKLSNDEVAVKCIHSGVGAINESDIILASASNAIVIGFNIRPDARAKETAETEGVDVRLYRVIYNAIEDIESAMKGMLDPIFEEQVIGHAEIRQTYKASGVGMIAGSYVLDGIINRNCSVRITREGNLIYEGKMASLKRFKDDVKEVKSGFECGIVLENFNDIQVEDQIEAYQMVEVPRK